MSSIRELGFVFCLFLPRVSSYWTNWFFIVAWVICFLALIKLIFIWIFWAFLVDLWRITINPLKMFLRVGWCFFLRKIRKGFLIRNLGLFERLLAGFYQGIWLFLGEKIYGWPFSLLLCVFVSFGFDFYWYTIISFFHFFVSILFEQTFFNFSGFSVWRYLLFARSALIVVFVF